MRHRSKEPRLFRERGKAGELFAIHPEAMSVVYDSCDPEKVADIEDGIAVLTIEGPLAHKGGWFFDSYERILDRYRSCIESDDVRAIVLKLDSPGGEAAGLNETVDAMRALKKKAKKPVFAYADEAAYSAAYALSCVADELWLPRAGGVGSIGVVSGLVDWTAANKKEGIRYEVITSGKRKADGNPNVPISDEAIARVQRRVDQLAELFFSLVSDARGLSRKAIVKLEADTFYGDDAVAKGLADGVASLADFMKMVRSALDSGTIGSSRLQRKSVQNTRNGDASMATLLALTKDVDEAKAKLASAKKEDKAMARARLALATAALEKKMSEEDEEDEGEEEDEEDESDDSSSGADSTDDDSESEEDEEKSSTGASSTGGSSTGAEDEEEERNGAGLYTPQRAARMLKQAAGCKSLREAMGWFDAKVIAMKDLDKTIARVKKIEATHKSERVEKMIAQGKAERKITPGNERKVREGAKAHGPKWLRAFLNATMPAIGAESHESASPELPNGVKATAEQVKIWQKMGFSAEKIAQLVKDYEKEQADMAKRMGAAPKGAN